MVFFNVNVESQDKFFFESDSRHRTTVKRVCGLTKDFMEKSVDKEGGIFLSSFLKQELTVCMFDCDTDVREFAKSYLETLKISYDSLSVTEISIGSFFDDLSEAEEEGMVASLRKVAFMLGIDNLYSNIYRGVRACTDRVVDDEKTVEELYADARNNYLGSSYEAELKRIFEGKSKGKFLGHPAHYIISSENDKHRKMMIEDLISALYIQGRLLSRRYTIVAVNDYSDSIGVLQTIYSINEGATVLLKIEEEDVDEDGYRRKRWDIENICEFVKANCTRVLTIFSIASRLEKIREKIKNVLAGLVVVDIPEDTYCKESAVNLICDLARKDGIDLPQDMTDSILKSDRGYDFSTLSAIYRRRQHEYLSTVVYPEYKSYFTHESDRNAEKKLDAYHELKSMIGLTSVKKIVDEAVNYFSLQNEYRLRGLSFYRPAMHMVFTGSPGTAKTSVARLVARILKEKGVLSSGELIEVGRADLIGRYVGHTAPLVKSFFSKAQGSVLFIDEAYSLVDDRKGLYGDEAINTIVQEMENHRDDVIVIFAGYQNEMRTFLERNPGLDSRIAFHVPFEDYSEQELLDITRMLAQKTGYSVEESADEKLISIFRSAKTDPAFGNGRFARNLLEKAKLAQSNRMVAEDLRFVSDAELTTLKAEDFSYDRKPEEPCFKIGFSA